MQPSFAMLWTCFSSTSCISRQGSHVLGVVVLLLIMEHPEAVPCPQVGRGVGITPSLLDCSHILMNLGLITVTCLVSGVRVFVPVLVEPLLQEHPRKPDSLDCLVGTSIQNFL